MKRILSIISFVFGSLVILLLVLALAYRDQIMRQTVDYIAVQIEAHTGYQVKCGRIQLAFPMDVQIECVKVFSKEHPQLYIDNLEVRITPWGALRRHIVIDSVKIGTLSILAPPDLSTPTAVAWDIIPGSLKIDTLLIERLHVAPAVMSELHLSPYDYLVSEEAPMRIAGRWAVNPFAKTLFADFVLSQASQPANQTHLIASLSQPADELDAHIRITESDHGILAEQFELPHGYNFQGIVHVKGSPDAWHEVVLSEPNNGSDASLSGDFQFSYASTGSETLPIAGQYGFVKGPFSFTKVHDVSVSEMEGLIGKILFKGNLALTSRLRCDGTNIQLDVGSPIEIDQLKVQNIHADCQLTGEIFCPNIGFQLKNEALDIQSLHLKQILAQGNLQCALDVLSGTLSVSGKHDGQDWKAFSAVAYNTDRKIIGLSQLQFSEGALKLSGELQLDIPKSLANGDLEGFSDAALLQDLIGTNAEGLLVWKANLYSRMYEGDTGPTPGQALDLFIKAERLHIDKLIADEPIIALSLDDPFADPSGMISFTCPHASWDKWDGKDLSGETIVKLDSKRWPFSFSGKQKNLEILTTGSWHLENDRLECAFDKCEGIVDDHAFTLQDPVHIAIQPGSFEISPVAISIGQGSCYAAIDSPTGYVQVVGRMKELPLDLLKLYDPALAMKGSASGELFLIDSSTGVTGNIQFNVANAEMLAEPYTTPTPWHASFNADLRNDSMAFKGYLAGIAPNPIELTAVIPVQYSLSPFSFNIDKEKNLSAHLLAQGNIESLLELILPVTTTNLTGQTTLALNVSGTMDAPQVNGQMDLINGTFEILDIGASVKNVKAHFNINGTKLTMTELTSVGQESGTIVGSGTAELDFDRDIPFDFSFQLDKLGLRPLNYTYVTASGPLRITGNAHGGALKGKIVSNSLQMYIPEKIPELAQSVEVKYVNQPSHLPAPTVFVKRETKWPLTFDVALEVPNRGMINGKDWTSEWKGAALLTGDTDHWEMHGTCKVSKGEFRFNGKSFEINQGTITFAGEPDKKTSLYVIASKDIDTIHAEIILKGDINHPAIAFRSNPPMSQREILSWILFNRGTSDITAFQGTQLNESITELNTGNRQPDMLTQIRERFGVDKIDITNERGDNNDVSLQVGKYISKGVLVSVQKSITAEANSLSIEADLIKHFKVQAEVDDEADAQLRLKWKKDY